MCNFYMKNKLTKVSLCLNLVRAKVKEVTQAVNGGVSGDKLPI